MRLLNLDSLDDVEQLADELGVDDLDELTADPPAPIPTLPRAGGSRGTSAEGRLRSPRGIDSLEQLARDILTVAIRDGLVATAHGIHSDPDPQTRTAADLMLVTNLLSDAMHQVAAEARAS